VGGFGGIAWWRGECGCDGGGGGDVFLFDTCLGEGRRVWYV
jgi:hypothetical protein